MSIQYDPQLSKPLNSPFGEAPEDLRSLDFWLCQTGPTLANYGPNFGFWCGLIPMWAWRSEPVRNILVATTLIDEQLGLYRTASLSEISPVVISHYHAAIKAMATAKQPNKICLTLASLFAWVFETLQKNYPAARIHINAASRLLSEIEAAAEKHDQPTLDLIEQTKPVLQLSQSYTKAICEDALDLQLGSIDGPLRINEEDLSTPMFHSLRDVRNVLLDSTVRYLATDTKTDYTARMQRLYVKKWHRDMRQYCSCSRKESHLYKKAVQLYFNLGIVFLPEAEAGAFSYQSTPNAVRHLLEAFERLAAENQVNKLRPENEEVAETLLMAVDVMIGQIRHDHLYARAALLLLKLRKQHKELRNDAKQLHHLS